MEFRNGRCSSIIDNLDSLDSLEDDTTGIRRSLNQLLYDEEEIDKNDEGEWRLSYLKKQYESLEIQSLFRRYTDRINHGYFSLFLILQIPIGLIHFGVLWYANRKQYESLEIQSLFRRYTGRINHGYFSLFLILQIPIGLIHFGVLWYANRVNPNDVLPDLIIYGAVGTLPLVGLLLPDDFIRNNSSLLKFMSLLAFILLFFTNAFVPYYYYYYSQEHFRPAYTIQLILSAYIFFHIQDNIVPVLLGIFVSIFHAATLIMITYADSAIKTQRVITDVIFLFCLNSLGVYFRYMNEIVKRKSFLDTRAWVESNFQLHHEKQQEEQLMSSIMPQYIIEKVKHTLDANHVGIVKPKCYNAFTGRHDNVTILFADIVNYTEMTSKLDIKQLIKTLNELFGRFDDASEELNVLRIKFLGDCYYCVAGLPPHENDNHGEACVDLGLRMISIISDIRLRRKLNINMRIGIHSGSIISGIIGISKWQYDIWSNDVDIANKMETEGEPGKVHITNQTKVLLKKSYAIVPTHKGETVTQFKQNGIETFLISPDPETLAENKEDADSIYSRRDTYNVRRNTLFKKNNPSLSYIEKQNGYMENGNSTEQIDSPRRSVTFKQSPVISYIEAQMEKEHINKDTLNYNEYIPARRDTYYNRRNTISNGRGGSLPMEIRRYTPGTEEIKRRTAFMNNNLKRYEERLQSINKTMKEAIENMSLSKYQQWFKFSAINPFLVVLRNIDSELQFMHLPDHLFKYYILGELLVIICVFLIQNITLSKWQWSSWSFYTIVLLIVFVFLPLTWTHHLWCRKFSNYEIDSPTNPILKFLYHKSKFVTNNLYARIVIYTIMCALFTFCIFSDLHDCEERISHKKTVLSKLSILSILKKKLYHNTTIVCIFPWHMSQTASLAIIMSFLFLRIHLWIKFVYASIISLVYIYILWTFDEFYQESDTFNTILSPKVAHVFSILFLTLTLHLVDRQTNYMYRLDYLWNEQLIMEQKEANKVRLKNIKLLTNILPLHVAKIYLNVKRQPTDEFYHEYYNDVAVMFASIIDYPTISKSEQMDCKNMGIDPELNILRAMNKIFVEFDKLTIGNQFGRPIEKIKITKWTYMAACGLAPGLGEIQNMRNDPISHVVITLLKLASEMMKIVPIFNMETGQECKLRIGISYGKVVAGVVGSKKPLYDIWGDTVNMASRMDTTGLPNKIQVLEATANIIEDHGYECTYRDMIYVKGKDRKQVTYFVSLNDNFNLKRKEN